MAKFPMRSRVVICSGRLKGETGTVIGETNLNMHYRLIVCRDKGRDKTMGFEPRELRKIEAEDNDNG